jgi:hypothetical protein
MPSVAKNTVNARPDHEPELGPCDLDGLRKIGVIRDEQGDVDATLEGVQQQIGGQIHIRALFIRADHSANLGPSGVG